MQSPSHGADVVVVLVVVLELVELVVVDDELLDDELLEDELLDVVVEAGVPSQATVAT